MSDKSDLEGEIVELMQEYKQPLHEGHGNRTLLIAGVLGSLIGSIAALACAATLYLGNNFFNSLQSYVPITPTASIETIVESPTSIPTVYVTPTPTRTLIPTSTPTVYVTPTPPNTIMPTNTPIPINTPIPTPNYNLTPLPAPQVIMEGPFMQHYTAAIGSGPLMNVTYSNGMAPDTDALLATNHYRIQRIRPEENPDGCGVSIYNTNKIWFGSAMPTTITVNDAPIAKLYVASGKHGYIFEWPLKIGDKICVTDIHPSGYHFVFGPDLYWHYDSYCYRGHC